MIKKIIITLLVLFLFSNYIFAKITIQSISILPDKIKHELDLEEKAPFMAPMITRQHFDRPECKNDCQAKLLLEILLKYSNYPRSTSDNPQIIIDSKNYFPYFSDRKILDTTSVENSDLSTLTRASFQERKRSGLV